MRVKILSGIIIALCVLIVGLVTIAEWIINSISNL